jgi:hypothetical protein
MATIIAVLKRLSSRPPQILRSLRPTPSTVSYTVSTRQQSRSLPARLAFYIGIAVRILIGISALVLLWTKWRVSSVKSTAVLLWLCGGTGEEALVELAQRLEWQYLAPGALLVFYLVLQRGYKGTHPSFSVGELADIGIRRIPHCALRPRRSDLDHFLHLPPHTDHALHTNYEYPGHLHT